MRIYRCTQSHRKKDKAAAQYDRIHWCRMFQGCSVVQAVMTCTFIKTYGTCLASHLKTRMICTCRTCRGKGCLPLRHAQTSGLQMVVFSLVWLLSTVVFACSPEMTMPHFCTWPLSTICRLENFAWSTVEFSSLQKSQSKSLTTFDTKQSTKMLICCTALYFRAAPIKVFCYRKQAGESLCTSFVDVFQWFFWLATRFTHKRLIPRIGCLQLAGHPCRMQCSHLVLQG